MRIATLLTTFRAGHGRGKLARAARPAPLSGSCRAEPLEGRALLAASPVLYASDSAGRLFTLNEGTGATQVVGDMAVTMFDIAFDRNGRLFGVDPSSDLYRINRSTAAVTRIGSVGRFANALAFSPTGRLFAAGGTDVFEINTATGASTSVRSLGARTSGGDMDFDAAGRLFLTTSDDQLVRVNPATGGTTLVGPIGFQSVFGLAFRPSGGPLYGLSNGSEQLFRINTSTGQGTAVANFGAAVAGVNGASYLPATSLSVNDVSRQEGNAGQKPFTFTVTRSGPTDGTTSVRVRTQPVTANAGATPDYAGINQLVTFAPGQISKTVTANVFGDTRFEPDETFRVVLSNPVGARIGDGTGTGTIRNDDTRPLPALSVNEVRHNEGTGGGTTPFTFTVTRSGSTAGTSSVRVRTNPQTANAGGDSDYIGVNQTITFAPGQASRTVTVNVFADAKVEPDEAFLVLLSEPVGATLADPIGAGIITNDDRRLPALRVSDASAPDGQPGRGNAGNSNSMTFNVTLDARSDRTVTVRYATTDGTSSVSGRNAIDSDRGLRKQDFVPVSGTLTFLPGETSKSVTVTVRGDRIREGTEEFNLNLSSPVNAQIADRTGVGTIPFDDRDLQPALT